MLECEEKNNIVEVWLPFDLRRAIIIKFILIIYHALIGLLQEETTPLGLRGYPQDQTTKNRPIIVINICERENFY